MWFGTQDGLNRFDGYRFEVFETKSDIETSISQNGINGITEDPSGHIWIATQNGLSRYSYESGKFLRIYKSPDNKGISNNKVSYIYKGQTWDEINTGTVSAKLQVGIPWWQKTWFSSATAGMAFLPGG